MAQLLSNLPNGSLVKFGKHQVGSETAQPIIWMVVDKNHSGYPSNSVTLITRKIVDLRAFDAFEVDVNGDSVYGNPNYELSNIHQWLNSDAGAGNWYTSTHYYDNPPTGTSVSNNTEYTNRPGFLYNFTTSERKALLPTSLKLQINDQITSTITARVFLPSVSEILGTYSVNDGSTRFTYFATNPVTSGVTSQVYSNSPSSQKPTSVDVAWYYWCRNNYAGDPTMITSSGDDSRRDGHSGHTGVRPVVNLAMTTKISDSVDVDGCYTVLEQNAPVISGSNRDLGIKSDGFVETYNITDSDGEVVTVKEFIDNVEVRSYVATLGTENTFNITGKTWLKLTNGTHTLKITATDGFDTVERICTFAKSMSSLVAQRTTPISASTKPTNLIVTVVKNIPYNATMKVEACNNGFDANPTWEDITDSVTSGLTHVFSNATKTASQWGVNIRVTVDRNGGEGACYITEIGGNFE